MYYIMCTCTGRIHHSRHSVPLLPTMATNIMKEFMPDAEIHMISRREDVLFGSKLGPRLQIGPCHSNHGATRNGRGSAAEL